MPHARTLILLPACVAALGGCGAEERSADVDGLPTKTVPRSARVTRAPAPAATAPSGPTAPPGAAAAAPGSPSADPGGAAAGTTGAGPGGASADSAGAGAGDEEPISQPARFTVGAGTVQPASVTLAPFLAVAFAVVNLDSSAHQIKLVGTDVAFVVQPGGREERALAGLPAGMYTVAVDGGATAAGLVIGDGAGR